MLNPYAFAKYTGEQICEMFNKVYGLKCAVARFFNVYGDRQPITGAYATVVGIFEGQHASGVSLTVTGDGEQRRDFTHVSDIVSGLIAMEGEVGTCELYQLGTGTNYSINELAGFFGGNIEYVPARPGEARTTLADNTKAKESLSWSPKILLQDYVTNKKN